MNGCGSMVKPRLTFRASTPQMARVRLSSSNEKDTSWPVFSRFIDFICRFPEMTESKELAFPTNTLRSPSFSTTIRHRSFVRRRISLSTKCEHYRRPPGDWYTNLMDVPRARLKLNAPLSETFGRGMKTVDSLRRCLSSSVSSRG